MAAELSDLMSSGGEPQAYEKETFGSSPEMIKGGRRRKSRGKKSRKSRRIRKKTRGGNDIAKLMGKTVGGKSKRRKTGRKRR